MFDLFDIQNLEKDHRIEINVAFGGSDIPPLIRTVSYLIPALHFARSLYHQAYHVILRIINASAITLLVNTSYHVDFVRQYGQQRLVLLQKFIETFTPELVQSTVLADDYTYQYPKRDEMVEMFDLLNLKNNIALQDALTKCSRWASKRIHTQNIQSIEVAAKCYIYSHLYFFHEMIDPHVNPCENLPETIVSFGGEAERPFNLFREHLSSLIQSNSIYKPDRSFHIIQPVGTYPPYYATAYDIPIHSWETQPFFPTFTRRLDKRKLKNDYVAIIDFLALLGYHHPETTYKTFCVNVRETAW